MKALRFLTAFAVTFILLSVTAAGFFVPAAVFGNSAGKKHESSSDLPQNFNCTVDVLVLYDGGDRVFACTVTVGGGVFAKPVGNDGSVESGLLSLYRRDGIFAVAEAVKCPYYLKFTPENFEKFADKFHGAVYNENGSKRLMTGGQAAKCMCGSLLAGFSASVVELFYPGSAGAFLAAVEGIENNLSYPALYRVFGQNGD